MTRIDLSKWAGMFCPGVSALLAGCSGGPSGIVRIVTAHVPPGCAAGDQVIDGGAYATYTALGDFEPTGTPATGHLLGSIGEALPEIGMSTRELVVDATERDGTWVGDAPVGSSGGVDVLLLPYRSACAFEAVSPTPSGAALVALEEDESNFAEARIVLVSGGRPGSDGSLPASYAVSLETGTSVQVEPDLLVPRADASATTFGPGALVAGGFDPRPGGGVLDTAEVFAAHVGGFLQQHPILLSTPRASHGAVVLDSGETLLVGGVGSDGATVLDSMEIVDPKTSTVRVQGLAHLAAARRNPEVLRLASGEILVTGGLDAQGNAVATLEWFAPDAHEVSRPAQDLVVGAGRVVAALPAGGALAVIAPPAGAVAGFASVWVIASDGTLAPATAIPGALTNPVLFDGPSGKPALFTGDRWLRWQPWSASFEPLELVDPAPGRVSQPVALSEPGLALWRDAASSALTFLRFDSQNPYGSDPTLLSADASGTAPDRLPALGEATFDPGTGLSLGPSATVFVLVRTYADVSLRVEVPTGQPPQVVFRDDANREDVIGGSGCPYGDWPAGETSLQVTRRGATAIWGAPAGTTHACTLTSTASARIRVGLRGDPARSRSVARNLTVTRLGSP